MKNTKEETLSDNKTNSPEVEQELSQVATNPKQSAIILIIIVLIFAYLFFNFFINASDDETEKVPTPNEVVTPTEGPEINIPTIPTLPPPPKLEDLEPPSPPRDESIRDQNTESVPLPNDVNNVTLPTENNLEEPIDLPFTKVQDDQARKRKEKKIKSSMILIAGQPPAKTPEEIRQEADFNYRGDMNLVLGRGKIINAVVESAISTDFGGEVRAVINKDTYSEWGKNILIPKGSRVFGNYSTNIDGAYGRINIIWTRIDLANGFSLNLDGVAIDNLGRSGQQGRVDNKFRERISNAILRSAFDITLANALDKVVKPQINSQAAAQRNLDATNIKNIANGIFTQSGINDRDKRTQICASVLNALTDKTSQTFIQIQATCNNLATDPGSSDDEKLLALMNFINSTSDSLIQNASSNVEETKAQSASKDSFENISDTLKSFVEEQDFKPTITIDQGTVIKIYVNKDYKFPKNAVSKTRRRVY